MNKITENLHWFEDTCSVYAIRAGDGQLVIDCGSDLSSVDLEGQVD